MSSTKKKPSRKPSVLVSRQFTCTNNAFINNANADTNTNDGDDDDQTTSTNATSNKKNIFSSTVARSSSYKNDRGNSESSSSSSSRRHQVSRKIMWNGRDATPRPLVGRDGKVPGQGRRRGHEFDNNTLSFDDINNFFESSFDCDTNDKKDVDDNFLDSKAVGVPWIPTVMEQFCHSFLREKDPETKPSTNDTRCTQQNQQHTIIVGRAPPQDSSSKSIVSNDHGNNDDNENLVEVQLQETETIELLSISSSSIPRTSTYFQSTKERNEKYAKACTHQRKECPKKFKERAAQTFHSYHLDESTQTETRCEDVGVGVEDDCQGDYSKRDKIVEDLIEELTSAAIMTEGCLLDVSEGLRPGNDSALFSGSATSSKSNNSSGGTAAAAAISKNLIPKSASYTDIKVIMARHRFYESNSVIQKLSILERAVQQNICSTQQIKYRGVRAIPDLSKNENVTQKFISNCCDDSLELLFTLKCDMASNMKVSSMSWSRANPDMLAVGYGRKRDAIREEGFLMLWSIRNPQNPEKLFKMTSSVTAVDFASEKPEMIAVGLYDGRILIFDTKSQPNLSTAILDSAYSPGRHMAAVSEIRWVVDRHQASSEKLISISIDGRVLQWSLKKGLSISPLMSLKRCDVNYSKGKLPNAAIGLSMDFSSDGISYITGSDDGSIHRCSRSYSERPLCIVKAHNGPLTSVKFSPFLDSVFITGASDSIVKIHSIVQKRETITDLLAIHPVDLIGPVNDVTWSPKRSTLFALVGQDGRMELWDISKSLVDPILSLSQRTGSEMKPSQTRERTVIQFSLCGDAIIVGDDDGNVEIFRLHSQVKDLPHQKKVEQLYEILKKISESTGSNDKILK